MAKKVLGQSSPAATTNTDLYTVPTGKSAVLTLFIANRGSTSTTYRVYLRINGAAVANSQAIAYDVSLPANSTDPIRGICLTAGDVLTVYSGSTNLSFVATGDES